VPLYEIVNPSDPYTIECPDNETAFVACLLLGNGQYMFKILEGDQRKALDIPMFVFGGADAWVQENFSEALDSVVSRVMTTRAVTMAEVFDSVLIGRQRGRVEFLRDAPTDRAEFVAARARRHDQFRTSMNDIGGRAYSLADYVVSKNKLPADTLRAPQQVFGGQ